jgi:hypothetical protein
MDKNALEQLLSSYNWWMGLSTVAVAVGILGEYVAHFVFEKEARRNKLEMGISILFGVLVLGGVVGEYVFGNRLSQVSEQLQQVADTEVAQSNKDAAQARKDAEIVKQQSADTNERASKAEQHAAEASAKAERFRRDIAKANESAAQAKAQVTGATAEATKANLELARLKVPRTIGQNDQQTICNALLAFAGTKFDLYVSGDQETIDLMGTIKSVLICAKWVQVPVHEVIGLSGSDPRVGLTTIGGVRFEIADSRTEDWGVLIQTAAAVFRAAGIDTTAARVFGTASDSSEVHLAIGKKPL